MNIGDIARLAGVSSSAVSRYFNNGYVSEEKREAIAKVVEETGFRPSMQARTLRTKKSKLVGVIIPRIDSAAVSRMVGGILSVLRNAGYYLVLASSQIDQEMEMEYLSFFASRQVDGILFIATVMKEEQKELLCELAVPVVIVGQEVEGFSCVFQPDLEASYNLTRLVIAGGSRKPCYIGALPEDQAVGLQRRNGFLRALSEAGIDCEPERMVVADFSLESGYEKAGELLERYPDLDALICATDDMAVGSLKLLKERGIPVPQKVQVVGHGNTKIGMAVTPSLTTVRYDYEKTGEVAAQKLLQMIDQEVPVTRLCMGYTIERRHTTRHAPG